MRNVAGRAMLGDSTVINLFNDKLIVECIRKLVRKSHTPVVPIANTCSIGYPHEGRAENAAVVRIASALASVGSALFPIIWIKRVACLTDIMSVYFLGCMNNGW